eukprot:ctg_874.g434
MICRGGRGLQGPSERLTVFRCAHPPVERDEVAVRAHVWPALHSREMMVQEGTSRSLHAFMPCARHSVRRPPLPPSPVPSAAFSGGAFAGGCAPVSCRGCRCARSSWSRCRGRARCGMPGREAAPKTWRAPPRSRSEWKQRRFVRRA